MMGRRFPWKNDCDLSRGKHTPSPFGSVAVSQTFLNAVGGISVAVERLTVSAVAGGGRVSGAERCQIPWRSPREQRATLTVPLSETHTHTDIHTLTGHDAIWDADPTGASILTDTSSPVCAFWLRAGAGKLNQIEMLG